MFSIDIRIAIAFILATFEEKEKKQTKNKKRKILKRNLLVSIGTK
jgi:hypothetical protein